MTPNWNVSPGHDALVVRLHPQTGARHLDRLEWGLAPNARSGHNRPHNVRVEEIESSEELGGLAERRRCLVPVDAFYVWHVLPSGKQPFAIGRRDNKTMGMAGLWQAVKGPQGEAVRTFAILTTPAAGVTDTLQNRMPVVLEQHEWPLWLGEIAGDHRALLQSRTGNGLHAWRVSPKFGRPTSRGVDPLSPVYDVIPGDPFVSFRLAGREVGSLRARLENLRQRCSAAIGGGSPTQPPVEFEALAGMLAQRLAETERLCAEVGLLKVPPEIFPNPAQDVFGYRPELLRIDDSFKEIARTMGGWPGCGDAILSLARDRLTERFFRLRNGSPIGSWYLVWLAEELAGTADQLVAGLEAAASSVGVRDW